MPFPAPLRRFRSPPLARALAIACVVSLPALARPAAAAPLAALAPSSTLLAIQAAPAAHGFGGLATDLAALPLDAAGTTLRSVLDELQVAARGSGSDGRQAAWLLGAAAELLRPGGLAGDLRSACPALAGTPVPRPQDALLALSASGYAPLPAALLLVRVAPADEGAAQADVEALTGCFGNGGPLTQDGTALQPLSVGGQGLSLARVGNVVAIASRVDLLRSAVRLAHGSGEPSLAARLPASVPALGGDGVGVLVDTQSLAALLGALPGLGADPTSRAARSRVQAALRTVPLLAMRLAPEPDGLAMTSWTRVDPNGGDAALADLLRCQGCRARPSLLTPASAVAVEASPLRLQAWARYLSGLVRDVAAAGGTDVDPLAVLAQRTGLDLPRDLFPWLGEVATRVRLPAPAGTPEALLGAPARLTIVPVASAEAARSGLARLGPALAGLLARLPDSGTALGRLAPDRLLASRSERYRGVSITRIQFGPGTDLGVALIGSRLVLATPAAAMHAVVDTYRGGPTYFDGPLAAALRTAPADARAVAAADAAGSLRSSAAILRALSQPLAFGVQTALLAAHRGSAPEAAPPSLAALLTLTELPADALDAVAAHLGVARSWVAWQDGVVERHWRLPIQ